VIARKELKIIIGFNDVVFFTLVASVVALYCLFQKVVV
jgi:hypothetical protein